MIMAGRLSEIFPYGFLIAEMCGVVRNGPASLMILSGNKDHILWLCRSQRNVNGFFSVRRFNRPQQEVSRL